MMTPFLVLAAEEEEVVVEALDVAVGTTTIRLSTVGRRPMVRWVNFKLTMEALEEVVEE